MMEIDTNNGSKVKRFKINKYPWCESNARHAV